MSSDSSIETDSSTGEEKTPDRSTAHVGLVCTHGRELTSLLSRLDRRRCYSQEQMRFTGGFFDTDIRVAIVEAGAGFAAHRKATEVLVKEHAPAWVVSTGFSSSLAKDVRAGDLSLADTIRDTHRQCLKLNCPIPESKHATIRTHLVTDSHPATSEQKQQWSAETAASAVDTTSLAVAQICQASHIPCLSIRAIIDDLQEEMPESVLNALFEPDSPSAGNPISRWVSNLRQSKEEKQWFARAESAAQHLDRFLSGVIRQLGDHLEPV
ncbi:MAG: hypothetical protein MK110_04040 [Fuerstiella sp.]|nr:hypothetical protein [Fuerstiella sp.]